MKILLIILIITTTSTVYADNSSEAMKKVIQAISKTAQGKKVIKKLEDRLTKVIPVNKKWAATIGSTAATLAAGRVDTKNLKNMDMKFMGGKFRPDIEYDFKEKDTKANLKMNWNW